MCVMCVRSRTCVHGCVRTCMHAGGRAGGRVCVRACGTCRLRSGRMLAAAQCAPVGCRGIECCLGHVCAIHAVCVRLCAACRVGFRIWVPHLCVLICASVRASVRACVHARTLASEGACVRACMCACVQDMRKCTRTHGCVPLAGRCQRSTPPASAPSAPYRLPDTYIVMALCGYDLCSCGLYRHHQRHVLFQIPI